MTRKLTSVILAFILLLGCTVVMTACGTEKTESGDEPSVEQVTEQKTDEAESDDKEEKVLPAKKDSEAEKESVSEKKSSAEKKSDKSSEKPASKPSKPANSSKPSKPSKPADKPAEEFVSMSIDGCFSGKSVVIKSGDSVYDILKRSGVSVSAENTIYGVYVKGINGLKEGDKGAGSGWTYKVNGEMPSMSAGKYKPKAGDNISWEFVKGGF